ncbi:MAG: response regulator [Myxococcota bacterium]
MSEPSPLGPPVRVLLLEDSDGDAFLVQHALESSERGVRYQVDRAARLGKAREKLAAERYDIVLVDLRLPDSAGLDTVVAVREAAGNTPIVVLTIAEDDDLARSCIELGAQDYVGKNEMTPHQLRRVLGYALSRAREARVREAEIRELQRTLVHLKSISSAGSSTSITARLAGLGPLQQREPEAFEVLKNEYTVLLDAYLDEATLDKSRPRWLMGRMATRIGNLGAGPRDLIDLHVAALEALIAGVVHTRAQFVSVEGRVMALEMMGHLVDYYRLGVRFGSDQADGLPDERKE